MRHFPDRKWFYIVLSALLQIAVFPVNGALPYSRAAFVWVALVPMLLALLDGKPTTPELSLRQAALLGYVCGFLWYIGNCYWIYQTMNIYGGLSVPVSLLVLVLFALYLGLYHAMFAVLLVAVRQTRLGVRGAILLAPFVWVAVELARARITVFPWDLLGYSQIDNSVVTRLAPWAGVMAISFVIAAINALISWGLVERKSSSQWVAACALAVALVLEIAGAIKPATDPGALPYRAVMMQENIEVGAVGRGIRPLSLDEELTQFSAWSLHPKFAVQVRENQRVRGSSSASDAPTVIIWPEAPSHLMSSDPIFQGRAAELARSANAPFIAGSLGVDRSSVPERGYYLYDSATIFDKLGSYIGRYDKIHLVPFGEYVPFREFFSFAQKLTEGVGDMDRGSKRDPFKLSGHNFGVFICYESIFGDEVRHFVANGAEVLVNISDDGWYGDSGAPWQHLNMARMRAIENHRWVLRDTDTGVTTAIDPEGRMAAEAPRHQRAAFSFGFDFEPSTELTFYTRHGDWFAWLCVLVTLAALGSRYFSPSKPEAT